jgi:hypothetical protein
VDWTRGFRKKWEAQRPQLCTNSAFIPKCSLNLLSLVLIEIWVERVATNVAANVQKRAGLTGIGMVNDEVVVARSFEILFSVTLGTVLHRSYVKREK